MKILIAEDDLTTRTILTELLKKYGHEVVAMANGMEALAAMQQPDAPRLAILDWVMPEMDGIEVCRRIRTLETDQPPYIIMLTVKDEKVNIVAGLEAGADDYLVKPFDPGELRARINVGWRMVELQAAVGDKVRQLRESEEKYKALFNNAQVALFRTRISDSKLFEINERYANMAGYSNIEDCIAEFNPADAWVDPNGRNNLLGILQKNGFVNDYETEIIRRDGTPIWILFSATVFPGQEFLEGSIVDITTRKRAEGSLRESEDRYRRITEGLSDYLYTVLIHDGHVVQTIHSPACEAVTGYTAEEFASNPYLWIDMVPEQEHNIINEHVKNVLSGKNISTIEHHIVRKDGNIIRVSDTPIPRVDSQGVLISYDGVIKDITELKQAEEEKLILEGRLQQADKMEAIGTLAGGIAHDFNNLLMGIQGYASLMLLDLDPSHPHYERLKRIEEQVQDGADLTRQLLGFARGGRYEVKPADMNDIIKKTSSMFGRTKKEISIHRKYGKDLRTVEVDLGQMEQVFMNLYVNAWQAMPGGGELYLETENVLLDDEQAFPYAIKPGRYIKISMTDTGTGMDEKTKERIFDPFFTTKEMGRGTGLGLATVYGIIKGHNGFINVYSEPGHGTTFTIYLPASEKEVVKEKTATRTIAKGTETILLVDDEKMVLEVSKALLESMGCQVYAVGSGQEAIAVYMEKGNEIDLVLLDMIMPGISGGETFDRLREINSKVKVLLSSGYSIEGQAREILDRGCNGFIQKPFQLEKLSNKVREMLD